MSEVKPGYRVVLYERHPSPYRRATDLEETINRYAGEGYTLLSIVPHGWEGDLMLIFRDNTPVA
jgi:hypothetical protein